MLSKFSVKKPVTITMMICIVILLGAVSLSRLSIDLMPSIEMPIAIVQTTYYGAGSEEIENLVTRPLEQALVSVENIDTITSISSEGSSLILLQFNFDTDMDFIMLEMREKIDLVKRALPDDATAPIVMKMDPNSMPIVMLAVSGKGDIYTTQKITEDIIQPRLERIEGVASADLSGGLEREVQIALNQEMIDGYGLSQSYVTQMLQAENINVPGGSVDKGSNELTVKTVGEFKSLDEIRDLTLPLPRGGTVRLRDVADVNFVNKDQSSIAKLNGQDVIQVSVMKQSDGNTVGVSKKVAQEIKKLQAEHPDISIMTVMDQADYINLSINNLINNAVTGALLAVVILFIFLRSIKTTAIIAVSIPISIVTTFVLLYFSGITLNMMSLGGLALGVGMLVDNSIVVLENIHRHRSLGADRIQSSILGANEVSMAVTASTLTTIAVFLPIVFTGGMTSVIFREFAMTIVMSLVSSLVVALTLIPMMSSKLISVKLIETEEEQEKRQTVFVKGYKGLLGWCLRHRFVTLLASFVLFAASIVMLISVGAELFPNMDQGQINVTATLPTGSDLAHSDAIMNQIQDIAMDIPEVDKVFTSAGSGTSMMGSGSGSGSATIMLKDLDERERSTSEVTEILRQQTKDIPGAEISVSASSAMSMGMGGGSVSITVKGDDLDELKDIGKDMIDLISTVPGTREVTSSYEDGIPEVRIASDRAVAAQYGLTTAQIGSTVKNVLSGSTVSKYKVEGDELDIVLKGDNLYKESMSMLETMPVSTATGGTVPLGEVADISIQKGPVSILRENQTRVMTVSADITGRDIQSVSQDVSDVLETYDMPEGYTYEFGGTTEQMNETFSDLFLAIVMAIVLVYMILAAQFESMIQPLSIMFAVPLALSGGFIALFITRTPLNVVSLIGFIMLVGIVVNNAIVLIDYINTRRSMGEERTSAILKAGPIRIRPIMMTALTTILGLIPMSLGIGEGAELTSSMGIVVIGGLTLSTLLTLLFVPVMYSIFDDIIEFIKRKLGLKKYGVAE